jgi:hypothetical protein
LFAVSDLLKELRICIFDLRLHQEGEKSLKREDAVNQGKGGPMKEILLAILIIYGCIGPVMAQEKCIGGNKSLPG